MNTEHQIETITQPRSEIADALTTAVAEITGLKAEQIITINASPEQILIGYRGAGPGLLGGHGRIAMQTWDTRTGKLIKDEEVR